MSHERVGKTIAVFRKVHLSFSSPPKTLTRHQLWQAPVISSTMAFQSISCSSQGTCLPCYLCTWKCLWIQVRECTRSATRAAVYYTTSEGAPTLKWKSACYRPFFQRPWNNNGLWLERYPWVTLAAFHKVELFTVRWIKERVAGGASLFHMNDEGGRSPSNREWQCSLLLDRRATLWRGIISKWQTDNCSFRPKQFLGCVFIYISHEC